MLLIVGVVWRDANEHLVQQDTKKVPVYRLAVALTPEHLWSQVGRTATERSGLRIVHDSNFGQAEICEKCVAVLVVHNIVRLQVPKNDIALM